MEWKGEEEERRLGREKGRRGRKRSDRGLKGGQSTCSLGWEAVCLLGQVGLN